jgi:hypothetical protein
MLEELHLVQISGKCVFTDGMHQDRPEEKIVGHECYSVSASDKSAHVCKNF